jgi:uncharacterized protein YqjF (DUF2071 family)
VPLIGQSWRTATFFHWDYPPHVLERFVPRELELDTLDGRAWVGLTPFVTTFELAGIVPLPGPRWYPETNLRTYVRVPDGSDGVWFPSLDVTNLVNVPLGRLGMPYFWADLGVDEDGQTVRYCGRRRGADRVRGHRYDLELRWDAPLIETQNDLDVFLTGRWHTYTKRARLLGRYDLEHEPWPLHHAELVAGREHMLEPTGFPPPENEPVVHYSPGLDVAMSWPRPLLRPF